MVEQQIKSKAARSKQKVDYTNQDYWNGLIRMSMSKFFVLCVLANKPMHGYEINKAVERTTNGCCAPTPGALYPVLREFEEGGYVTFREETVSGRARKIYTITEKGKKAFDVAAKTWLNMSACITASASGRCDADDCC